MHRPFPRPEPERPPDQITSRREQIARMRQETQRNYRKARIIAYAAIAVICFAIAVTILVIVKNHGGYYHYH